MRLTVGGEARRGCWPGRWWSGSMVFAVALWLGVLASFALPVAARAAGSVYVTITNPSLPGAVSQYAITAGGLLSPSTPATVPAGMSPFGVAVAPGVKSVYVTGGASPNPGSGTVSQYSVDPLTGTLSSKVPATVATGSLPGGIAVTPDGRNAYVASNLPDNDVWQYSVNPVTGTLSPKNPATVAAGAGPGDVAVSPDGRSAYVMNIGSANISQYSIDPGTGALSPKSPATVVTGRGPEGIAVTPDGRSAYATSGLANTVSQYNIDPVTGALSPKTPATVATGSLPDGIAVTPDGKNAYVASNRPDNDVSQYSVDPVTGTLSPKNPATVAAGTGPIGVAVSPDGKSAYVTNEGSSNISQYSIDPSTGALSPNNPATVATGSYPFAIAVGPLPVPAKHATSTSVSCSPITFAPGDATVCRATVTDTAGSGQSTPTGTVSFSNSGAGRFYGSPCTLSGSGVSASCWVFFASFPRGGQAITASYGGDTTHDTSVGRTLVAVVLPASTNGCLVFGHGQVTAANGDQASFRGLAFAKPPIGVQWYRDNGPAKPFRLVSTSVDAVTCSTDASRASVFGRARLNGTGSVEYRIDIQLAAWEHGKDTYRIRLSNGYDSGTQQIRHGDLQIHLHGSNHHHHDANANQTQGGQQDGG